MTFSFYGIDNGTKKDMFRFFKADTGVRPGLGLIHQCGDPQWTVWYDEKPGQAQLGAFMATLSPRKVRAHGMVSSPLGVTSSSQPLNRGFKPVTLKFDATSFKPMPNPNGKHGEGRFQFYVVVDENLATPMQKLMDEKLMRVNPREADLGGPIMRDVADTWFNAPQEFHRVCRGWLLVCDSVKYNSEDGTVEIVFTNNNRQGLLDGGHVFNKVLKDLLPATYDSTNTEEEDQADAKEDAEAKIADNDEEGDQHHLQQRHIYVEVHTGLELIQSTLLGKGRNTSRVVPEYAFLSMNNVFDDLAAAIRKIKPEFAAKCLAIKPNEHIEGLPEFREVSVLEVIQLMWALDVTDYDSDNHPLQSYKNKGKAGEFYNQRHDEMSAMLPIIGDIAELYDVLRRDIPAAYHNARSSPRRWNKLLAGEGEKVNNRQTDPLYWLDPTGQTKVERAPNAVFFPMLSAFRAALSKVDGKYRWSGGTAPTKWEDDIRMEAFQKLATKMAVSIRPAKALTDVGRDPQTWSACYEMLNAFLLDNGIKQAKK
jgi:hypothetical protein